MIPEAATIDALFEEIVSLFALPDNEWKTMGTDNECTVYTRKYKDYPLKLSKLTTIVKYPVSIVKEELTNIEHRPQWDSMCKSAKIIQKVNIHSGELSIIHIEAPSIALLSPRDLVFFATMRPLDGAPGFIGVSKSVPNSEKDIVPKKDFIRIDMIISGSKMEEIEIEGKKVTRLTTISMADPKGKIPKINLKPMFMKGTESIKALRGHLKKKYPDN